MSRQLHCCDMCKISLWLDGHILNQSTANCGQILNLIEIPLVGRAPGQFTLSLPRKKWPPCWQAISHYLNQCWFVYWYIYVSFGCNELTHLPLVPHICVSELGQHQAIIWTNAGILLIGPLGTNFNGILIKIYIFSLKKMHLKFSSAKIAAIFPGGDELIVVILHYAHVFFLWSILLIVYDAQI